MNDRAKSVGIVLMSVALFWVGYLGGLHDAKHTKSSDHSALVDDGLGVITLRREFDSPVHLQPHLITQKGHSTKLRDGGPGPIWLINIGDTQFSATEVTNVP